MGDFTKTMIKLMIPPRSPHPSQAQGLRPLDRAMSAHAAANTSQITIVIKWAPFYPAPEGTVCPLHSRLFDRVPLPIVPGFRNVSGNRHLFDDGESRDRRSLRTIGDRIPTSFAAEALTPDD
jgi:hypothetical protein